MGIGLGGVGRTPGQNSRGRRNWDRLGGPAALIDSNNAIQLSSAGKIILLITAGQPFTQSSSGIALTVTASDLLSVVSSSLAFNDDLSRNESTFYGPTAIGEVLI